MKRIGRIAVPLIVGVCTLHPIAAKADIHVDPEQRSTGVRLEGEQILRPSERPRQAPRDSSTTNSSQRIDPFSPEAMGCRVDPVVGNYGCREVEPAEPGDDGPGLTPGDVLRAVREIGLPSLRVQVQPGAATLVNVPTIFYAEPQPFERSVELLGFDVDVVASPVTYDWVHGDGTVSRTDRPGRPYPAMDVTHRYERPADDVQARVDVTYQVRYRVDGGAWQTIAQTLVAAGPAATLDVDEAAPVLATP